MWLFFSASSRFKRFIIPVTVQLMAVLQFAGCGTSVTETSVKDYRMHLTGRSSDLEKKFINVIDKYNREAGIRALQYLSNPEDANSEIVLTKGLNARDGKVGWGQWISSTKETKSSISIPRTNVERVVAFTMKLELDEDYVMERIGSSDSVKQTELMKLFAHEVGHGFQMPHDPDQRNVMYYSINGDKDFSAYYQRVRDYFKDGE